MSDSGLLEVIKYLNKVWWMSGTPKVDGRRHVVGQCAAQLDTLSSYADPEIGLREVRS
jgi:hypothetical protein